MFEGFQYLLLMSISGPTDCISTQREREDATSTQRGQKVDLNPGPHCCEVTVGTVLLFHR